MTSILKIKSPVPSDIEIAQSVIPLHISLIAEALGLEAGEIDLYGAHKAKVRRLPRYALPCSGPDCMIMGLRFVCNQYLILCEYKRYR